MAALSIPFFAMLNGGFSESRIADIGFSENEIMAIDRFSKTGRLGHLFPDMVLEVLSFSNRFWCEKFKCEKLIDSVKLAGWGIYSQICFFKFCHSQTDSGARS
jgi:hypothetical protein